MGLNRMSDGISTDIYIVKKIKGTMHKGKKDI